jgi:hypothetical protein
VRCFAASILCCIFAFAQAPDAKPDDKCSVEGTVLNSATGEPVKKARVTLAPIAPRTDAYAATTDASGHFLIDEVDTGRFTLTASRSGYNQPISSHGGPKPNAALALEKGQKMKEIVIKLAPEGVISGRILDADGDPLEDVNIECMSIQYERGKRQLVTSHRTYVNELGEFRLPRLAAGKYIIRAIYSHYDEIPAQERLARAAGAGQASKERYVTTYYPSTMNPDNASPIEVSPGAQIGGITITLMRTRTFSIKGHVNAGTENRSRQSSVGLWPRGDLQPRVPMGAEVDSQGRFQLDGVAPGSYVLSAGEWVGGSLYSARMPLEVHDENIEGVELSPQPRGEVLVRAIIEGEGDQKHAPREFSLTSRTRGAITTCQPEDDSPCKFPDMGGDRPYDVLPIGLPENFYVKSARLGEQDVLDTGFEFTAGVTGVLTLVLNPNSGQIEGSVTNAKDEPAAGAKVTLIPGGGHQFPTRYKTTDTDQNGHFIIKGVAPGEYKIYAWEEIEDGAQEDPDFMKPHESDGQAVSIKERAHENVQLKLIPAESAAGEKPAR